MALTHRERFFQLFGDSPGSYMPFFPDITDWYMAHRLPPGTPQPFGPGQFIPDEAGIHKLDCNMPAEYRDLTLLEIYKKHDWGFPVHLYDWCDFTYRAPVRRMVVLEQDRKTNSAARKLRAASSKTSTSYVRRSNTKVACPVTTG